MRVFGELTDAENHEFGHVQEELELIEALRRKVLHRRGHVLDVAAKRLAIPDGTDIRVHVQEEGDHFHAYVAEVEK